MYFRFGVLRCRDLNLIFGFRVSVSGPGRERRWARPCNDFSHNGLGFRVDNDCRRAWSRACCSGCQCSAALRPSVR